MLRRLDLVFLDAEPTTQQGIALSLFRRVEVRAWSEFWLYPSDEAEAQGWAAAFAGTTGVALRKTGRGERGSPSLTHDAPRFLMINATSHGLLLADEAKSA